MYRTPAAVALLLLVAACGPASTEPPPGSAGAPASFDGAPGPPADPGPPRPDSGTATDTVPTDTIDQGGGTIGSGT